MIIARRLFCSLTMMAAASATMEDKHGMTAAELVGRKSAVSRKGEAEEFVIVELEDHKMIHRKAKASKAAKAVCHKTGNKHCPWKDLTVAYDAVDAHIAHGDKRGFCANSCDGCYEFDEDICDCVLVSCTAPSEQMYQDGNSG